jgi:hypothetical protein
MNNQSVIPKESFHAMPSLFVESKKDSYGMTINMKRKQLYFIASLRVAKA